MTLGFLETGDLVEDMDGHKMRHNPTIRTNQTGSLAHKPLLG